MTGLYRSGQRDPRTVRPWRPALGLHGHSWRLGPGPDSHVGTCGTCFRTVPTWAIREGYTLPICTGAVRALHGEVTR